MPADLADLPSLERAVGAFAPDVVIHLAAAVGDRLDDATARRANVEATSVLQRYAAERPGAALVVASTVLVLGLDDLVDAPETTPRTREPMIPYVASKVQMEELKPGARRQLPRRLPEPAHQPFTDRSHPGVPRATCHGRRSASSGLEALEEGDDEAVHRGRKSQLVSR